MRAARSVARLAPPDRRGEFVGLVEAAGNYLVQGRTAVRAMWFESSRANAETFDDISGLVLRCRDRLQALLHDLDRTPSALSHSR
ncbi:hypothetical protein [Solwaraspora sp. WMMD792]|uniref:hypothetical protein n=1 Tax=Solwaraspora sp. WMMD792 TaxID=3016099 RepID=UPI002416C74C|nr:hypothetical protein [Solwaraspora sp. WMMD792]MDG4774370.1 hypothetical protein [Solwaraspora sp. WMMD792]